MVSQMLFSNPFLLKMCDSCCLRFHLLLGYLIVKINFESTNNSKVMTSVELNQDITHFLYIKGIF